jgi:hypothetical protein
MKHKLLSVLLLSLLIPVTAFAQVTFSRTQEEGKLLFEILPGGLTTGSITLVNLGETDADVELYTTDGATTSTGGFTVLPRNAKQVNIGKWVTFDENPIHVTPDKKKTIGFTINIPSDVTPGTYGGGVSVTPYTPPVTQKATGVVTSTRVVTPFYVKVSGEKVSAFDWTDFSYMHDQNHNFNFAFSNKGNTYIKAVGEMSLQNSTGETYILPLPTITLLQHKDAKISIPWEEKPFFGFFTATATLKFSEYDLQSNSFKEISALTKTVTFSVIPWTFIIVVIATLILLIIALILRKILLKRYLKRCTPYAVVAGDTLTGIAKNNKIDWLKLAKLNKLKAPYELSAGQKILLPPKK